MANSALSILQYVAYTGPVETPPPPAAPALSWHPTYPDAIAPRDRPAPSLYPAYAPFLDRVEPKTGHGLGGSGILRAGSVRQYQSIAAPLFTGVVTTVEWVAASPDPIWLPWRPYTGLTWTPQHSDAEGSALDWTARYPDTIDRLTFPAAAQPFLFTGATSSTIPSDDLRWQSVYPDFIPPPPGLRADLQQPLAYWPFPLLTPIDRIFAWAIYPDRLDPLLGLQPAAQQAFALPPFVPQDLRWTARYPDLIDRQQFQAAAQQAFTIGQQDVFTDLRWQGQYPAQIDRQIFPAALQSAFTTGQIDAPAAFTDLRWAPSYPDQLWATRLPTAAMPSLSLEPFPRPPVDLLSAWAFYPDFIVRVTLPTAAIPSFAYGTWEPIPNPPVSFRIEDAVTIGQRRGLDFPAWPSIGGSTTWS